MSLPQFPTITPPLSREDAINQIISSIAMEELGLSHIINAEGEKLQYVLGTIPGVTGPSATIEDVLKVNESVRAVLQNATESQTLLRSKLQQALTSGVLTGPTGPTGPQGPATITLNPDTVTREPGEDALVENTGDPENFELKFSIPRGATGATGPATTAVSLSVLNNVGATISPATGGTPIPLLVSTYNIGFTVNEGATAFTVGNTGYYLVSYSIRTTAPLTGASSAIFLNGTAVPTTRVTPAISDTFYHTSIMDLRAESPLELRLSVTEQATLQSGVGATLDVVRLS